ncbi:cellobiose phosphorylase [Bacillus sp. HMF5848]|uniref:cellobiose phosphorylase n=1 Tax=Bacillus sp. HMF5848 TaxID=2495421 RepID=UPI000F774112|nr:cellobiose phosphorylase [Bacillus sp. HMF5848]RSK25615.1 cellobiose phosphorylase [Bacillus sp. HMF5848]
MSNYMFNDEQYFVINEFDQAKTFSSFLPGIAGLYGIPMWSFYVNRGQAMVSFGVQDKNHAITEFFPANQAYQRVATNGFRTFIKINGTTMYEPFAPGLPDANRNMFIKENELIIEDTNNQIGIKTTVTYFTLPNENFAALVRKVKVENLTNEPMQIEVVDGLPAIIPFGVDDAAYKAVGNTLKSWMDVFNLEHNIPYYRVRSSTNDTAEVEDVTKGHFYLSFVNDGELLSPIVDNTLVFGTNTAWSHPSNFMQTTVEQLVAEQPITANKVPSGFSGFAQTLQADEQVNLYTMIGHVNDIEIVNKKAGDLATKNYMERKYEEAQSLVDTVTKDVWTKTSSSLFDAYSKQNYLDNVLRGGYPVMLETDNDPFVYYVYSRKHGDLERDYNFFSLAPEFYSQGNGNFRDVNQNRRNDVFFNPEVGDYNIKLFMSLIQADGYNPLVVKGASFELVDQTDWEWLGQFFIVEDDIAFMKRKLSRKYTPGALLQDIVDRNMELKATMPEFLKAVLSRSEQNIEAEFGEGFWMDHWTYNLDLIENYLKIYPDNKEQLLFADSEYRFFNSHVYVKPRSQKYVLADGKVRQYGAIVEDHDGKGSWLTTKNGQPYQANLMSKLVSLALMKYATLDPFGMGVEMEANKPGWNDSMNGLPGLFGSAMGETFELKRVLAFILQSSKEYNSAIVLPVEIHDLFTQVWKALTLYRDNQLDDLQYWDTVAAAREDYRAKVRYGFVGKELELSNKFLVTVIEAFLEKLEDGIQKATLLGDGLTPTYFYFDAKEYEITENVNEKGLPLVQVKSFEVQPLPHFLEGPARALKTLSDKSQRENMYNAVRQTGIYDEKLHMYKTSSSLEDMTYEIGRARAFTPGWLERESIFMHMEFKYLLSVLKAGLYNEFFEDLKHALPPFMDPNVYGRSVLENSSFIASSANPDASLHGQGFVARLSGTTAEFLNIWQIMMMGKDVFTVQNGQLQLALQPIIPAWLFDDNNQVQFTFLGDITVTYQNQSGKNTFGDDAAKVTGYVLYHNGEQIDIHDEVIDEQYARLIRDREIKKIDVILN